MKRIVFFICFLVIMPISVNANVVAECNSGELEAKFEAGELIVNKRGDNPFLKSIPIGTERVYVNDIVCMDDRYILYGYAKVSGAPTYYDSYLVVLNTEGDILHKVIKDYGELEEIKYLYYVDNVYIVITEQSEFSDSMDFMHTYITIYDNEFNELAMEYYSEDIKVIELNGSLLSIDFQWDKEFDIGVLSNTTFLNSNQYLDIEESYVKEVYIPFINEAEVNGLEYKNGFYTDYPGYYSLVYNEQVYTFRLDPEITGVEDKATYNDTVSINVSSGNLFLNDELYHNNDVISEPGYYHLDVYGNNEYMKQITFTINSSITGVINGQTYNDPFSIDYSGSGYLNGNQVSTPLIIEEEGDYVFRVVGVNGYSEEYFFSLSYEDNFNLLDFIQKIDIYIIVVVVISGVFIIKKSK